MRGVLDFGHFVIIVIVVIVIFECPLFYLKSKIRTLVLGREGVAISVCTRTTESEGPKITKSKGTYFEEDPLMQRNFAK